MLNIRSFPSNSTHNSLLLLGAHCDDIEIGCGGTVLRLLRESENLEINWIVFSSTTGRAPEARKSASLFLRNAKKKTIIIEKYRDGFFPYQGWDIKEYFEKLKSHFSPDVVFTHCRHDLHQDHRLISEITYNTFRNHLILEYEVIKYDGDLGSPNFYIPLEENICREKTNNILKCFRSQKNKQWFGEDTFLSIMRIRGIESNAPSKYAEGYYCRKIVY